MKVVTDVSTDFKENPLDFLHYQSSNPGSATGLVVEGKKISLQDDSKKMLPIAFTPFVQRGITFSNRIIVSPMCMYSSQDGFLTNWHVAHYGGLSMQSPGGIIVEASAVEPHGRISINCAGIWKDEHIDSHKKVVDIAKSNNVKIGIQIVHSGRKGSSLPLWESRRGIAGNSIGGWVDEVYGPSDIAFDETSADPKELSIDQIERIIQSFVDAAVRVDKAGYDFVEIHAAHGYLLSSFLSPNANKRTDIYGGSFENRTRILLEISEKVRKVFPESKPVWVRISCHEWTENGWTNEDSVRLSKLLKDIGIDLIDCSSGGISNEQVINAGPMFQVPFAEQIRKEANIATGAVGMITKPSDIEDILQSGKSDVVFLARQFLLEPSIVKRAAIELGVDIAYPNQYLYAKSLIH
ncbi:putative NADPH dehydrogenase [Smittium culicis]|uniref:Putative NADPH dehydrogenase n=1 Tax=Smittium culicis TaxID=133412 RepID=A0A1R1YR59_9FUNG|nr:putative NADPH dehydrogenase [Smittium culicis]